MAALSVSATSAAACDLHGPGQFGGFHRYNPFAAALQNAPAPAVPKAAKAKRDETAKGRTPGSRAKPAVEAKEVKRRQRALEKELERDAGEGARSDLYQSADRSRIR
mgnify:FL=1